MLEKNLKRTTRSSIVLLILLFLLPGYLIAQRTVAEKSLPEKNWQLSATVNGVDFYYSIEKCGDQKAVFLKVNNRNKYNVQLTWEELVTTQAVDKTKAFTGPKKLVILPGAVEALDCSETNNRPLLILPIDVSPAYAVQIKKFEFSNISVSRL